MHFPKQILIFKKNPFAQQFLHLKAFIWPWSGYISKISTYSTCVLPCWLTEVARIDLDIWQLLVDKKYLSMTPGQLFISIVAFYFLFTLNGLTQCATYFVSFHPFSVHFKYGPWSNNKTKITKTLVSSWKFWLDSQILLFRPLYRKWVKQVWYELEPQIFLVRLNTGPPGQRIVSIFKNWFWNFSSSFDWSIQTLISDLVVKTGVVVGGIIAIVRAITTDMWW